MTQKLPPFCDASSRLRQPGRKLGALVHLGEARQQIVDLGLGGGAEARAAHDLFDAHLPLLGSAGARPELHGVSCFKSFALSGGGKRRISTADPKRARHAPLGDRCGRSRFLAHISQHINTLKRVSAVPHETGEPAGRNATCTPCACALRTDVRSPRSFGDRPPRPSAARSASTSLTSNSIASALARSGLARS
jgi:hypothetical protein